MQMSGDLLDTNIIIALFKNDPNVVTQLAVSTAVFVPAIALGELIYGALHSAHVQQNLSEVRAFANQVAILACDVDTAEHYGQIKHDLKLKGHPIPENDIWIAALAIQHGLTVVSRDQHFLQVNGLKLASW
jgi:tRNA(fMet)-specific endonuclease VapC